LLSLQNWPVHKFTLDLFGLFDILTLLDIRFFLVKVGHIPNLILHKVLDRKIESLPVIKKHLQ
jgi:hypothetical protein